MLCHIELFLDERLSSAPWDYMARETDGLPSSCLILLVLILMLFGHIFWFIRANTAPNKNHLAVRTQTNIVPKNKRNLQFFFFFFNKADAVCFLFFYLIYLNGSHLLRSMTKRKWLIKTFFFLSRNITDLQYVACIIFKEA